MERLAVPDDAALEQLLGQPVRRRERLHSWPLSLVERVETGDGVCILKTQLACASVESAFYAAVAHPRLLRPLYAGRSGNSEILILPFLEGPTEDWSAWTDERIRRRVRALRGEFSGLDGAPVFFDYSRREQFADALAADEETLRQGGLRPEELAALRAWLDGPGSACWDAPVGLLHGDLKGENLLDGRLIDWQRPMRGPLPLEEGIALQLAGRLPTAGDPFAALTLLHHAHWYAWAFVHCLPFPVERDQAVALARQGLQMIDKGQI